MMADADERSFRNDDSAAPEAQVLPVENKAGRKKKKKGYGCGFFLFLILAVAGVAAGLQASGGMDLRPFVYSAVPRIPYAGDTLKDLLAIPDIYAMTANERRAVELDEWEHRIADAVRSMDERERNLDALSEDLGAFERLLDARRADIASRQEELSRDIAERGAELIMPGRTGPADDIAETIRTFQDMSPRNAASILERLDEKLAVSILDGLPQDTRGTLLGRMDAEKAARLTEQLTELQRRRARQQGN